MTERETYTQESLQLHLFYLRILKEHAWMLSHVSLPQDTNYGYTANSFQQNFEVFFNQALCLSTSVISKTIIHSCELVTPNTLYAEQLTEHLSEIPLKITNTQIEKNLIGTNHPIIPLELSHCVHQLNLQILPVLHSFILYQTSLKNLISEIPLYRKKYLAILQHFLSESLAYQDLLLSYKNKSSKEVKAQCPDPAFWNRIMLEHGLFIKTLLDSKHPILTHAFPLIADHIVRETNRYLRLLHSSDSNE